MRTGSLKLTRHEVGNDSSRKPGNRAQHRIQIAELQARKAALHPDYANPSRQPQNSLPVDAVVSLDELVNVVWHVAHLQIAAAAQFLGNVRRDILRPAFGGVKGNYADRIFVFTRKQDDGFQIGKVYVGFPVDLTIPTKVVDHEIDVLIVARGHN
jgi:hypothetical protein